jgi:hypothetical protein
MRWGHRTMTTIRTLRAPVLWALWAGLLCSGGSRAAADEMKVHLESAALDKLPELKTYVSLLDQDNKPIRVKSGFKLFRDEVEMKDMVITSVALGEAKEASSAASKSLPRRSTTTRRVAWA